MLFLNKTHPYKFLCFLLPLVLVVVSFPLCNASWAVASNSELNFKVYNADSTDDSSGKNNTSSLVEEKPVNDDSAMPIEEAASAKDSATTKEVENKDSENKITENTESKDEPGNSDKANVAESAGGAQASENASTASDSGSGRVLQGYVRIVPTGTKIPIIMDTAVDSDTSQEGDEFSARTAEDLTIDGTTAIPAGSIIRGRIATLNAPKHLNRSGSVALRFDTVTTPDNRQIPLVANLVARGGVVHARRGLKDIAIDTATFSLPTVVALGIGAVAGHSSSSVGTAGGALIGAGVGAAVGLAILLAKKGKRVDVRPGDELKIELAEDLHMPTM